MIGETSKLILYVIEAIEEHEQKRECENNNDVIDFIVFNIFDEMNQHFLHRFPLHQLFYYIALYNKCVSKGLINAKSILLRYSEILRPKSKFIVCLKP